MPISVHDTKTFIEQSYLKTSQRTDVGSYQLDRQLSNDRVAVFYDQQTNEVVVVNRGTAGTLQDWTNNVSLARGQYDSTERMKNALDTQLQVKAKYQTSKITNIAHSQSQAIVANLNNRGLTDEVITLNGATMPWDVQAANETRIRSNHDVVSAVQALGSTKRRNTTIDGDWNPLTEHSTSILDRMNPTTYFGTGILSHGKQMGARLQEKLDLSRYRGGPREGYGITSDFVGAATPLLSKYMTAKQKAAIKRQAKNLINGLGVGHDLAKALGDAAIQGTKDGSTRLSSTIDGSDPHSDASYGGEGFSFGRTATPLLAQYTTKAQKAAIKRQAKKLINGLGVGHDLAKALGDAAIQGTKDGSTRLSSTIDGSDPHSDASYGGEGFGRTASKIAKAVEIMRGAGVGHNIAKALGDAAIHAVRDSSTRLSSVIDGTDPHRDATYGSGFRGEGGYPRGSAKAHEAMAHARSAAPKGRFVKGSEEARQHMAKLRAMRRPKS